ncbi:hypothetical protein QN277_000431 [Acacia crassicarpa]|uniref:Uncharacterized protein n=1 Tax=Acacia crassicarpa TaxID=499986 RepID=A0AAE1TFK1_9FABA|nr:hypothetical protein QN277_000431 [Acacia crassicarpa]
MPNPQSQRQRARAPPSSARPSPRDRVPLRQLFWVASMADGIQFGWALQLSLLTPYVQQLGIPHTWASMRIVNEPTAAAFTYRLEKKFGMQRWRSSWKVSDYGGILTPTEIQYFRLWFDHDEAEGGSSMRGEGVGEGAPEGSGDNGVRRGNFFWVWFLIFDSCLRRTMEWKR